MTRRILSLVLLVVLGSFSLRVLSVFAQVTTPCPTPTPYPPPGPCPTPTFIPVSVSNAGNINPSNASTPGGTITVPAQPASWVRDMPDGEQLPTWPGIGAVLVAVGATASVLIRRRGRLSADGQGDGAT